MILLYGKQKITACRLSLFIILMTKLHQLRSLGKILMLYMWPHGSLGGVTRKYGGHQMEVRTGLTLHLVLILKMDLCGDLLI